MKLKHSIVAIGCVLLVGLLPLSAQLIPVGDTTFQFCAGRFQDSGGSAGAYRANERWEARFCPDGSASHVRLRFVSLDIGPGDQLCVYDGRDTTAALLACFGPGQRDTFQVQASASNPDGCLTVRFVSDGSGQAAGWDAELSCGAACQAIGLDIDSLASVRDPLDSSRFLLCLNAPLYAKVSGVFPQNNIQYAQSDGSIDFSWNLGNGARLAGPELRYTYPVPGTYPLYLTLSDVRGCRYTHLVAQTYVAPRPEFIPHIANLQPLCLGDTVRWNGSAGRLDPSKTVSVLPGQSPLSTGGVLSPPITELHWRFQPGMIYQNKDSIGMVPDTAGSLSLLLLATDSFNCVTDTALSVEVRPLGSPFCPGCLPSLPPLADAAFCAGDSTAVSAAVAVPDDSLFAFKANPQHRLGFANHPPANPYAALLPVQAVPLQTLTDPLLQIDRVCMTIRSDWDEDLDVFLRAPSGELLELSTGNGGGFDDYENTCFTPASTAPITSGAPPFTGFFQPEGAWNALQGAQINGDWALVVSDGFDLLQFGRVESWTITFKAQNAITYTWIPSEGLSCSDCPDPVIRPDASRQQQVIVTDLKGCEVRDTFAITVVDSLEAPSVVCSFDRNGNASFSWNAVPGAGTYNLVFQVNGKDSVLILPATDTLFLPGRRFQVGDSLSLVIQAGVSSGSLFCGAKTSSTGCVFQGCSIDSRLANLMPVLCFGGADGRIEVEGLNGVSPYQFQLDGAGTFQDSGVFSGLSAGPHYVIARDQNACSDTLLVTIQQPDSLYASLRVLQNIQCAGDTNGQIQAEGFGGTGSYSFSWSHGASGNQASNLASGSYTLTLRDSLGCTFQDSVALASPEQLLLTLSPKNPSCAGIADGRVAATVRGGSGPLAYAWSSGTGRDTLAGLGAGAYCLTVTDSLGCAVTRCTDLMAPSALRVDSFPVEPVDCRGRSTGEAVIWISGGTGPYQYLWSDPLAQVGPLATMLPGGRIQVRVTDANLCRITVDTLIPEPEQLQVTLLQSPVKCRGGADGQMTALPAGGTAPYQLIWNTGQAGDTLRLLPAGTFEVTVTDRNGCMAFSQNSVTEPAEFLTIQAEQTEKGCFGEKKNSARAIAQGGNPASYSFAWSQGATGASVIGLDSVVYRVTVTDANGCTQDTAVKLQDLPDLDPNMIINAPFCFGASNGAIGINFINGRPNANLNQYSFFWSTGATGPTIANLKGDLTYSVTVVDPSGCIGVESRYLRQPRPIQVTTGKTDVRCNGGADGTASVVAIDADTRVFSYQWDVPLGPSTASSIANLPAGKYRVTVTDEFGCFGTGEADVFQPEPVGVQFVISNNRCFGDATGALLVIASGGTPGYQLQWADAGTGFQRTGLPTGLYQVTLTDSKGCTGTGSAELKSNSSLSAALDTREVTCHGGRDGVVLIDAAGGRPPYSYSLDGKNFRQTPTLIGLKAGNYDITIRDANGCQVFERAVVREPVPFEADAGLDEYSIKLGDTLTLTAIATGQQGAVRFSWLAPYEGTLSCTACEQTVVTTQNSISYELLAIDSAGCEATDRVTVNVRKDRAIWVPTGFTPNGDGQNDLLRVHGLNGTRILRFQVFDRWGELVYEHSGFVVNDPSIGWDGIFRNKPVNPGVYVWYLEAEYIDGYQEVKRGQSTLIR
ncbi:MAG: hypothetical protein KIPDCIKN_00681 [Haliscomenobacter sp.]|nr:hypothetical protein [Haliscomenobacter sp.]